MAVTNSEFSLTGGWDEVGQNVTISGDVEWIEALSGSTPTNSMGHKIRLGCETIQAQDGAAIFVKGRAGATIVVTVG